MIVDDAPEPTGALADRDTEAPARCGLPAAATASLDERGRMRRDPRGATVLYSEHGQLPRFCTWLAHALTIPGAPPGRHAGRAPVGRLGRKA